jgi:hypothetical protein
VGEQARKSECASERKQSRETYSEKEKESKLARERREFVFSLEIAAALSFTAKNR